MSMKQIRRLIEKLEDALQDMEIDLDAAVEERDDYEFRLTEKTEELELMEDELRFLCKLIYDADVKLPRNGLLWILIHTFRQTILSEVSTDLDERQIKCIPGG